MEMPALPISPPSEVLLSPLILFCLAISTLILISIHQSISSSFRILTKTHFSWPPDSPFHHSVAASPTLSAPVGEDGEDDIEELGVVHCKAMEAASEELVQCAVCLCNIQEGEEMRELRCKHLFHRACLDTWMRYRHMTCPICREALPKEVAEKLVGRAGGDQVADLMSQYSSFIGSSAHHSSIHDSSLSLY